MASSYQPRKGFAQRLAEELARNPNHKERHYTRPNTTHKARAVLTVPAPIPRLINRIITK